MIQRTPAQIDGLQALANIDILYGTNPASSFQLQQRVAYNCTQHSAERSPWLSREYAVPQQGGPCCSAECPDSSGRQQQQRAGRRPDRRVTRVLETVAHVAGRH